MHLSCHPTPDLSRPRTLRYRSLAYLYRPYGYAWSLAGFPHRDPEKSEAERREIARRYRLLQHALRVLSVDLRDATRHERPDTDYYNGGPRTGLLRMAIRDGYEPTEEERLWLASHEAMPKGQWYTEQQRLAVVDAIRAQERARKP